VAISGVLEELRDDSATILGAPNVEGVVVHWASPYGLPSQMPDPSWRSCPAASMWRRAEWR
jgi:hypothetical protein